MVNPVPPTSGMSCVDSSSITASGGGWRCNLVRNASTAGSSPSTSTMAPELSLRTEPVSPAAAAQV